MSTPIQPVPPLVLASEFPSLADRQAGTYNGKAKAWADSENAMAERTREIALTTHNNAVVSVEQAVIATGKASEAGAAKLGADAARDTAELHKQGAQEAEVSAWAAAAALGTDPGLFPQPLQPGKVLGAVSPTTVGWIDAITPGDTLITINPPRSGWIETGKHYLQSAYTALFSQIGLIKDVPIGTEFSPLPPPNGVYGSGAGTLRSIIEPSPGVLIACGGPSGTAAIYRSIDNGISWATVFSETSTGSVFYSLASITSTDIVAVGNNGGAIISRKSTDGGATWGSPVTITGVSSAVFGVAALSGSILVAVGVESGNIPVISRSVDAGASWSKVTIPSPGNGSFQRVINVGDGVAITVGQPNKNYRTVDYGATWSPVSIVSGAGFYGLSKSPSGVLFAAGTISSPATVYAGISKDGGATWSSGAVASGINSISSAVCVSDRLFIIFCTSGNEKTPIRTADGGESWKTEGLEPSEIINVQDSLVLDDGRLLSACQPSNSDPNGTNLIESEAKYDYDTGSMFWVPSTGSVPEGYNSLIKAG